MPFVQEGHWPIAEEILKSVENGEERRKLIEGRDLDGNHPALLAHTVLILGGLVQS